MQAAPPKVARNTTSDDRPDTGKRRLFSRPSIDKFSLARRSSEEVNRSNTASSSISTAFRFADFVSNLNDVSSDINSLVTIIKRVRDDISTALGLRQCEPVKDYCACSLETQSWIDNIILDVQVALNDIGSYIENVRKPGLAEEDSAVKLKHNFLWVMSHHHKIKNRQNTLIVCHQSLSAAINLMQMVHLGVPFQASDAVPISYENQVRQWIREGKEGHPLRGPHMRRMQTKYQRNFPVPNITVSHVGDDDAEVRPLETESNDPSLSVTRYSPAELEGDTPEDLVYPGNWEYPERPVPAQPVISTSSSLLTDDDKPRTEECDKNYGYSVAVSFPPHVDTVPQMAKRYRAKLVQGAGRAGRGRSLTQLPNIPQSPSLISEMARWVEGYNLDDATADVVSAPSGDPPLTETPPTSCTSSSEVVGHCPVNVLASDLMKSKNPSGDLSLGPGLERKPSESQSNNDWPNVSKHKSNTPELPEGTTDAVVRAANVASAVPAGSHIPALGPSERIAVTKGEIMVGMNDQARRLAEGQPGPGCKENRGIKQVESETLAPYELPVCMPVYSASKPDLRSDHSPSLSSRPDGASASTMAVHLEKDDTLPNGRRGLTPQAKRRRAHHRRMMAAYEQGF